MAFPITGPFERLEGSIDYGARFIRHRVYYRQAKPYTLPLTFTNRVGYSLDAANWRAMQLQQAEGLVDYYASLGSRTSARNKAYAKLLDKLNVAETSSMGVTMAQHRQAGDMFTKRINTLTSFTRFLQLNNSLGVSRALSIPHKVANGIMLSKNLKRGPGKYSKSKTIADLWLEFWFGWKPMVSDIHNAMGVLEQPVPPERISGQATIPSNHQYNNWGGPSEPRHSCQLRTRCRMGCEVTLENSNLRLSQQLGLLNLGLVAWDAIPWSFVVDWGFGISAWISSYTDFAGLTVSKAYTTDTVLGNFNHYWSDHSYSGNTVFYKQSRAPGLVLPRPAWKFSGFKPTRAATAISLLVQQLDGVARRDDERSSERIRQLRMEEQFSRRLRKP